METKFNFNSQICTSREQSERLLALGLKKETADCYYWQENDHIYGEATGVWHLETLDTKDTQEHFEYLDKYFGVCLADDEEHYFIPAWSLGRLVEIINKCNFESFESEKWKREAKKFCRYVLVSYSDDLIETSIEIIEALIKKGYFNKEYLV